MLETSVIALRLIGAVIVGLLVGFSRRKQAAGMRTFALICLGSALFTILSMEDIFGPTADKTRIISQIVTGIGFLGLGVIWKQGARPQGLTTAAAIWTTAALGVLIGLEMWVEVALGTFLTLAIVYSKPILMNTGLE